jgi:hypothetical protein
VIAAASRARPNAAIAAEIGPLIALRPRLGKHPQPRPGRMGGQPPITGL